MRNGTRWMVLAVAGVVAPACAAPSGSGTAGERVRSADRETRTLEFMTLNIWHDQQDWPARLEVMLDGLRATNPDVICLQEVLQHETLPNQAETLATRLGYTAHFASWDSVGSARRYGNAILTRAPVLARGHDLLDPPNDYRVVAHARIAPGTDTLDIYCTHLHHTQTPEGTEIRRIQVLDALEFIDATRGDGPVIFAGDFNAPADAPELASVLDRFGDAYADVHGGTAAAVTTLNTAKGHRFERIDHVFYRSGATLDLDARSADVVLDEPSAAGVWPTDHFGVLVAFELARMAPQPMRR